MPLVQVRKFATVVEEVFHEGGPVAAKPFKQGACLAVVHNPFAGRYEP
ncbi:MAG: amino acid synthesis family protein, partial [Dongiaceae bacterium]